MEPQPNDAAHEEITFEPYPVLPAGMYRARLTALSNLETQFGNALKFHWKVIDGEHADEEVSALANKRLLPKSKLAGWAKAHLGIPSFPEDFVLRLDTLINKEVFLTLGVEPRADGLGERNVVRAVDPVRPATAKKAKEDDFPPRAAKPAGQPVAPPEAIADEPWDDEDSPMSSQSRPNLTLGRMRRSYEINE